MKYLFLLLLLCSFTYTTEPKHEGKSNIDVLSAKTQQVFGKNIGYYVEFKNKTSDNKRLATPDRALLHKQSESQGNQNYAQPAVKCDSQNGVIVVVDAGVSCGGGCRGVLWWWMLVCAVVVV